MRLELGSAYHQGFDVLAQEIISADFLPDFRDERLSGRDRTRHRRRDRPDRAAPCRGQPPGGTGKGRKIQLRARRPADPAGLCGNVADGIAPPHRGFSCQVPRLPELRPKDPASPLADHDTRHEGRAGVGEDHDDLPQLRLPRHAQLHDFTQVLVEKQLLWRRSFLGRRRIGALVKRPKATEAAQTEQTARACPHHDPAKAKDRHARRQLENCPCLPHHRGAAGTCGARATLNGNFAAQPFDQAPVSGPMT